MKKICLLTTYNMDHKFMDTVASWIHCTCLFGIRRWAVSASSQSSDCDDWVQTFNTLCILQIQRHKKCQIVDIYGLILSVISALCQQTGDGATKSNPVCERWLWKDSSVTSMLIDLHWNTPQERRMQVKSAMLYRIVHNLVAIPATPFLIPVRTSRGHSMKFFIPQSTVNSHLILLLPKHHPHMEAAARVCRLSCQLRDIQTSKHTMKSCFRLYIDCF